MRDHLEVEVLRRRRLQRIAMEPVRHFVHQRSVNDESYLTSAPFRPISKTLFALIQAADEI